MTSMDNTPDSPAKTPEGYTTQGGNFWTLITPEIWKVLHAVLHPLGQVLATPGALELLQTYQLSPLSFIQRHVVGDWGDICAEDRQVNADALQYGSRLMSVYAITPTETLWIITEADRSCTTLLLPQEY